MRFGSSRATWQPHPRWTERAGHCAGTSATFPPLSHLEITVVLCERERKRESLGWGGAGRGGGGRASCRGNKYLAEWHRAGIWAQDQQDPKALIQALCSLPRWTRREGSFSRGCLLESQVKMYFREHSFLFNLLSPPLCQDYLSHLCQGKFPLYDLHSI